MTRRPLRRSALFLLSGNGILMMASGTQATLLILRAEQLHWSTLTIGALGSMYFVGFVTATYSAIPLLKRLGHVRLFAALTSIASATILLHGLVINPAGWLLGRFLSGFCISGSIIVIESWLNAAAKESNRGRVMGAYLITQTLGWALGQLILLRAGIDDLLLFALTSILLSFAMMPVLFITTLEPKMPDVVRESPRRLMRDLPIGVTATFASGLSWGAIAGTGVLYAKRAGLNNDQSSVFLMVVVMCGLLLQWPFGILADKTNRRLALTAAATTYLVACVVLVIMGSPGSAMGMFVAGGIVGAISNPLYSLAVGYVADAVEPQRLVATSAMLVGINGFASMLGPLMAAAMLESMGLRGFWAAQLLAATAAAAVSFVERTEPAHDLEPGTHIYAAPRMSPLAAALVDDDIINREP